MSGSRTCAAGRTRPRRAAARAALGRVAIAVAAASPAVIAACVEIQTAPGGVASLGLDPLPPSIVAGDVLRDTLGREVRLRAVAYDGTGNPIEGAELRYAGLSGPGRDTTQAARVPLVVDSLTGAVRALAPRVEPTARLGARLGDRLQILDTIAIVLRPTALRRGTNADSTLTLRYLCVDTGRAVVVDTVLAGNATPPLRVRLTADSAGASGPVAVAVPNAYVRYRILAPSEIPRGRSPYGDERPAFYLTPANVDRPIGYDTTGGNGETGTRLRVLPQLLTRARVPDTLAVRIEATARGGELPLADTVRFTVRLVRRPPTDGGLAACP